MFRSLMAPAFALLLGACAHEANDARQTLASEPWLQTAATLPDGGPPVDADGFFDGVGSCPGEGCDVVAWHIMREPVALYAEPNRTAAVVATLAAGEWVRAGETVHRWRPSRGVVVSEVQNAQGGPSRLAEGDVVYSVDYEGEGFITLWRRGDTLSWYDDGGDGDVIDGIRWDPRNETQAAADRAGGGGWWIQMSRENGQTGWMLGEHLSCYPRDLTEECASRNLPSP